MQTQTPSGPGGAQGVSPASPKEPFPFSHKRHGEMKLDCSYCHEDSQTGLRAGFPAVSQCMKCHATVAKNSEQIKKLALLSGDTRIIPEKPVYKLPDFVVFSHARHKTGGIECAACHGNVWESDIVELQLPMKMKACVDCHKTNHAAVTCTTCHEAFQQ
jgi:Cytochrome c7 and related cytochrome c/Class III cytochrome C family